MVALQRHRVPRGSWHIVQVGGKRHVMDVAGHAISALVGVIGCEDMYVSHLATEFLTSFTVFVAEGEKVAALQTFVRQL